MRREVGAAIVDAIPSFDEDDFVTRHLRCIIPALSRTVRDLIDFTDAVRENLIGRYKLLLGEARRIRERQRRAFYGASDRAPDIHLEDSGT